MTKKNLFLGGLLAILVALAFVYSGPFEEWKSELGKPDNFLAKLDVSDINRFEIEGQGGAINIDKIDTRWKIEDTKDFYITDSVINRAIESLKEAKKIDIALVSENKDKKGEFETSKESGYSLKLKNGEELLAEFIIGKSGNEFSSSYISEINSDSTYLIKSDLRSAFGHDEWYDKTILTLDKDAIDKVRLQYPSREFTIEKQSVSEDEKGEWSGVLPYKFSVDQEEIDKILDVVSELSASEIPEQTFEGTGLEKNLIIAQFLGENIDVTIMIGEDNGNELYYLKKGDSDNIYLISKEQKDELEKRISDLR